MTEVGGDLSYGGSAFEHVGGEAVPESVDGQLVVGARQSAFGLGDLQRGPDTGLGHGMGTPMQGLSECGAGVLPAATGSGEQPAGVAVAFPEEAQTPEKIWSDRDFTLRSALALDDPDDETPAVDVPGLDGEGLAHAQSALVDDGEVGAVPAVAEGVEQECDFLPGQDVGKRLGALDADLLPDVPVSPEVFAVEGAQGTDGLIEGARSELALLLEVDQEIKNPGLADPVGGDLRVVRIELPDPVQVDLLRPLPQSFKLDEPDIVKVPLFRGEAGGGGFFFFFSSIRRCQFFVLPSRLLLAA